MNNIFLEKMKQNSCIAAVKDEANLDIAVNSSCTIIFILCGDIFNLKEMVARAKAKGKLVFIHIDLIDGFSRDTTALRYIHQEIKPDGIISTKNNLLKTAKQLGLLTVQRLFIIDSISIDTTVKAASVIMPDAVEILPGIMPRITKKITSLIDLPIITGGLISEREDIENAIQNGASGVSTSNPKLW